MTIQKNSLASPLGNLLHYPLVRITKLGKNTEEYIQKLGAWGVFVWAAFRGILLPRFRFSVILKEIYLIGNQSVSIIALTGLFTGMVLGVQGYHTLARFGSEDALGSGVIYTMLSELGPVLTALLLIGRAGSALCAELGVMRHSNQIDQLTCMAIEPMNFLVSPKLAAGLISTPVLTLIFSVFGIVGGYIAGVLVLGISGGAYFNGIASSIDGTLMRMCLVKAVAFGFLAISIAASNGFNVHRRVEEGASGISRATTSAVVTGSITVLFIDYLLTSALI
ncbi:MAG: ABC transporter permease [Leptospiraceae bacterium]|nr:ABC transporter permease [Leptospiraceae bacterium]MCB1200543.1 ABC transporter permease [Leptospiraceae bacterium]